jgi:UDPglucose 6-dehydrogenase
VPDGGADSGNGTSHPCPLISCGNGCRKHNELRLTCQPSFQLRTLRPGSRFEVLSNPEFLSEGTAVKNLLYPDRVLIGSSNTIEGRRAAAALANVYASWIPRSRILGTNVWSSELSKLVANAMLAQRISSINSISQICEKTGANVHEVAKSIGLDPRIGPQFLKAGLGYGGSCFRKDIGSLVYLAKTLGLDEVADYWDQVQLINDLQRSRFARKVISRLNGTLISKKVTLLGFAFKKDICDTRESVAIDIIRILLEERPEEIAIFDPCCSPASIQRELDQLCGSPNFDFSKYLKSVKVYTDPYQACLNTNAILIITDWDKFRTTPSTFDPNASKQAPNTETTTFSDLTASDEFQDNSSPLSTQYLPEPPCPSNCPACGDTFSGFNLDQDFEWARILYHMKKPKWVFDGRGVLDVAEMERLGVRVEVLGRAMGGVSLY